MHIARAAHAETAFKLAALPGVTNIFSDLASSELQGEKKNMQSEQSSSPMESQSSSPQHRSFEEKSCLWEHESFIHLSDLLRHFRDDHTIHHWYEPLPLDQHWIDGEGPDVRHRPRKSAVLVASLQMYLDAVSVIGQEHDVVAVSEDESHAAIDSISPSGGTIVSIRGSPPLNFLCYLGKRLNLDPALVLGALDIEGGFRLSGLPQQPDPLFTVSLVSVGRWFDREDNDKQEESRSWRLKTAGLKEQAFKPGRDGFGQSRRQSIHYKETFFVEQETSLLVYYAKHETKHENNAKEHCCGTWSGTLFNDSGPTDWGPERESPWWLSPPQLNPWPRVQDPRTAFYPLTRFGHCKGSEPTYDHRWSSLNPKGRPKVHEAKVKDERNYEFPDPCQSRADSDTLLMDQADRVLGLQDPMVLVCDLLSTSALSWNRCFDFLQHWHEGIRREDANEGIELMRRDLAFLERAKARFTTTLTALENRRFRGWPVCATSEGRARVDHLVQRAEADFRFLGQRATFLSGLCRDAITIAMSESSLSETRKSLSQAKRVEVLTVLAIIFVPMSFVTSFFGMNVDAFSDPSQEPLWRFFVVAIPLTAACLAVPIWPDFFTYLWGKFANWIRWSFWYNVKRVTRSSGLRVASAWHDLLNHVLSRHQNDRFQPNVEFSQPTSYVHGELQHPPATLQLSTQEIQDLNSLGQSCLLVSPTPGS